MASDMLRDLGYEVSNVCDGQAAVDFYANSDMAIDLVIIDLVMPKLNGRDCFLALRRIDPDVRAIQSSGYGSDGVVEDAMDEGMLGFVQKPYRWVELSEAVAAAMKQA